MPQETFKSWIVRILSGFSILMLSLTAWFLIRMVNNYDAGLQNQEVIKDALYKVQGTVIGISGDMKLLNLKIDNVAENEKKHYEEVQKLQKKIYNQ